MKHITLSTSRLQYTPTSHIAQQCDKQVISGDEAKEMLKKYWATRKRKLKVTAARSSEKSMEMLRLENQISACDEKLRMIDNETDIKITLLTPKTQWLC